MLYQHIVVEGNIGAGKTALAQRLAADLNARLVLEQFSNNPFLPLFYENPKRYAFAVELFFLAERYQQLKETALQPDLFQTTLIADYLFAKSALFASVNLQGDELRLFQRLSGLLQSALPEPQLVLYLHAPVEKLLHQIRQRGRTFEQKISPDYLLQLQDRYFDFFRTCSRFPVLIIDTTNLDFVSQEKDYQSILELLYHKHANGMQWISFTLSAS
ncbi:MAG: deoxynucleoside kinase [Chitinophagales bacterium]|nr:deoxynucleoside kinase [Chitinophagales bacterium]MDW8428017.1 deoxynucleoside kinase [Chitinophagales bacterium]